MDAPCISDAADPTPALTDLDAIRALLVEAARAGESVSYSHLLNQLGLRFTRPRMRALCRALDRIDQDGAARGEPGLAVLVVREADGLPGQGWWLGWRAEQLGWSGDWAGPAARAFVREEQDAAFSFWRAP